MLNNKASGDWNLFKGKVKEKWGKLTHDELDIIEGTREQLRGKLQEHYGYSYDEAKKEVLEWEGSNPYPWK